jgi:CO/xanthine dehydrogenase Mo-binding subunit
VATVSANMAVGIYYVPKVDITTFAYHSRGVTAGSMRGYGTVQSTTALEVMVDEICTALPLDPFEFRRRNALAAGGRIIAGNTYSVSIRTPEILDKLEKHPIWNQRAEEKARGQQAGILVGTGVACASKNYGTGGDTVLGSVEITPDGLITIRCDATEIGNAVGTAAANRIAAHLGGVADEIALDQVDTFGPLDLVTSATPTPSIRRRRTRRRAIRDGCRRSVQRPPPRQAPLPGHTRRPRPRDSFSALACGRRRSNCGASGRVIRKLGNGRRLAGRTGSSSCPDLSRWP